VGVTLCQFDSDLRHHRFRHEIGPDLVKEVWAFCYSAHRLLSTSFFLSHLLEVIPGHGLSDATWFFLPIDLDGHFCDHLKALVVDLVDTR